MAQKTMFEAKCTDCGKTATVPFKPTEGKPVYCNECFSKHSRRVRAVQKNTHVSVGKEGWARRRDNGLTRKAGENLDLFQKFTYAP